MYFSIHRSFPSLENLINNDIIINNAITDVTALEFTVACRSLFIDWHNEKKYKDLKNNQMKLFYKCFCLGALGEFGDLASHSNPRTGILGLWI